ncbi:vacuolar ATP synthase subunit, putative [Ichthyophthirius multifiliis]|uniref:Vacuolar ATP synthase subunit, putative n=1 Tax=Ichthyophthirius multifiliis TaxID=5932 RepID=G0QWY3_ICHMU|nr:vacuolar ATP synthase subunit, putative [Ichthyophthirius multifiliis]EGR30264.1 vacuolar ATP synthase subunit, putative [Ichthyophthirius multifiliis]|eukprot:XP_004065510.1 vacuolar ATP synthase subunit, putative [Ichthyophthirius multifiliis]
MIDFNPRDRVNKMVDAIQSEAEEKAENILKLANEQFKIQKNNLVNSEKDKIIEEYKRKLENFSVQKRIERSSKVNEHRLSKMQLRFSLIEKIRDSLKEQLIRTLDDSNKYKLFFKSLIVQSMIKLMEHKVELKVMKKDLNLARQVKNECEQEFKEVVRKECNLDFPCVIIINDYHLLEAEIPDIIGGIVLTCDEGKIKVVNTIDTRVLLAFQQFLPDIRQGLFPNMH